MGFTSYDQIINALSSGQGQYRNIDKTNFGANGQYLSSWFVPGIPAAGLFGTALTAREINNTTTGSIAFNNPSGSNSTHLLSFGMGGTKNCGTYILIDRLLEAPFDGTVTNAQFNSGTPLNIPARDNNGAASGEGCFMFIENASTTTMAAGQSITVRYTNSQGVTGRSTMAQALSNAAQFRIATTNSLWFPLQAGDTGVRAISGYTSTGSLTSTQLNLVVCRPLLYISMTSDGDFTEKDAVLQIPILNRLFAGTALQFILFCNGNNNNNGIVTFAEN